LILREIIKIVATKCHILRLKCTKFNFVWGSAPDPARGSSHRSPDSLAGFKPFKGVLFLREGEKGEGKCEGRKERGRVEREGGRHGLGGWTPQTMVNVAQ